MGERRRAVELKVSSGALDAWKGALALEWLQTPAAKERPGPSGEELEALLLDKRTLDRLRRVPGPWDVLLAQARSLQSHEQLSGALVELADLSARS